MTYVQHLVDHYLYSPKTAPGISTGLWVFVFIQQTFPEVPKQRPDKTDFPITPTVSQSTSATSGKVNSYGY
jgi:hypothetical protein